MLEIPQPCELNRSEKISVLFRFYNFNINKTNHDKNEVKKRAFKSIIKVGPLALLSVVLRYFPQRLTSTKISGDLSLATEI